ncbi:MAG: Plug domain-containing protein, partial [Planctomycetaceae bacterium]
VRPDTYTVKISLQGFQTLQRTKLVVNANDRLAAGNFTLQVGEISETVTVTDQSAVIQTRSGERAYTLESLAIQNIGVNGRSFFGLAALVPGVVPTSDTPTQVSNFNVNGQRANSNNFTVDGVANIDTGDNGGNMATINLDSVAEFKVLTSSYQAEYGRALGAQVQAVTKSGTKDFHGSAYWYARRSGWNANSWMNNRSGISKSASKRNDFGWSFGGPVYIPGLFNKERNKLFFFFNQEWQRRKDPTGEQRVTVPTALERKGDFSQSVDNNNNPYPYIRDYTLNLPCKASDTSGCFKDGGVLGKVPASRLYAPTLAILSIFPDPNVTGKTGYNYTSQTPASQPHREELLRIDYAMTDNWRMAGRYMQRSEVFDLPYGISGWSIGGNLDTMSVIQKTPGRNFMVNMTGVLSNTTSLEISFGQAHNSLDHYSTSEKLTRAGTGMKDLPMLFPQAIQLDMIPSFGWGGGRLSNTPTMRTNQAPFTNFNTTYDVLANLTKIMGSHATKVGVYVQRSLKDQSAFANFNGNINFNNNTSNPYDSTHPFSNAALGIYDSFNQASAFLKPKWRYTNFEWYLQDNWRANSRVTLDYGVRFYFLTPQWDKSMTASN